MSKKLETEQSFEASFERLESLVATLESGDLALEASMQAFEEGMALVNYCQKQLGDAEVKLHELVKNSQGQWEINPSE